MKKKNMKQIVAMAGVILLAVLTVATLLAAIFDKSGRLFQALLVATVATPILLWIYIWAYGVLTGKHTMASVDYNITGEADEEAYANEENDSEENADEVNVDDADNDNVEVEND